MQKSGKSEPRFTAGEKYASLKDRLAYYLLIQVYTFLKTSGIRGLPEAMKLLTEKAAEINVKEARRQPSDKRAEFLAGMLSQHMGETFSSTYHTEKQDSHSKVVLTRCGCIESILEHSKSFGLTVSDCKAVFCGSCMGGYRKSAEKLQLEFNGALTREGCYMNFKTP